MAKGAFALLDCLGFKGIAKDSVRIEQVLASLESIQASVEKWAPVAVITELLPEKFRVEVAFISDTIAISVISKRSGDISERESGYLVMMAGMVCTEAIKGFLDIPRALRGCIVYGEHVVRKNFLIGPAVDEAATLHEQAQGALIWATPTAARLYQVYRQETVQDLLAQERGETPIGSHDWEKIAALIARLNPDFAGTLPLDSVRNDDAAKWGKFFLSMGRAGTEYSSLFVENYPLPLKMGGSINTAVLNPFGATPSARVPEIALRILSTFDDSSLDVIQKHQNTETFLKLATELHYGAMATSRNDLEKWASQFGIALSKPAATK